jgi:hypothetical protein
MTTRTHFCFEIPVVSATSATSYEGASDHTAMQRRFAVASRSQSRSRGADTFHDADTTHSHAKSSTVVTRPWQSSSLDS